MSEIPIKTTYTLAEAAQLLSCHRETLRRAIRSGNLRAAKLGREFRVSRSDLEAFWNACGGGSLFDQNEDTDAPVLPRSVPKKEKKREPNTQLTFLIRSDE